MKTIARRKRKALGINKISKSKDSRAPKDISAFVLSDKFEISHVYKKFIYDGLLKKQLLENVFCANLSDNRFIFVFEFGVVVFWGIPVPDLNFL